MSDEPKKGRGLLDLPEVQGPPLSAEMQKEKLAELLRNTGLDKRETWRGMLAVKGLYWENPDDRLREIADVLRSGRAGQMFLQLLAEQIDPDVKRTSTGTKLIVSRLRKHHRPGKAPSVRLQQFLDTQIDVYGEKREAVFEEAKDRFGAGKSQCAVIRRKSKEWRKLYPIFDVMMRERAEEMRRRGDPDFQPLSG